MTIAQNHSIILVMGVSGCGKSTIAKLVAEKLCLEFLEGDDFHSAEDIAKMKAGNPLTDQDRCPWLERLNEAVKQRQDKGAVVACSALRKTYREHLLKDAPGARLVYLKGSQEIIKTRLHQRKGHFMPEALLNSQLATLEEPGPDEHPIVVSVHTTVEETLAEVMEKLGEVQ